MADLSTGLFAAMDPTYGLTDQISRFQERKGIRNPLMKFLTHPMTLLGLGTAGLGVGLGMAAGKGARGLAPAAERALGKKILDIGDEPLFHSRLARALASGDPNRRVNTWGDLVKVAEKGGGASKAELEMFAEQLGLRDVTWDRLPSPGVEDVPFAPTSIESSMALQPQITLKKPGSEPYRLSELLAKVSDEPPLRLEERAASGIHANPEDLPWGPRPSGTQGVAPQYLDYNPSGGTNYRELALYPRPSKAGEIDTALLAQAEYGGDHMQHLNEGKSALAFMLAKDRDVPGVGSALSIEQLQSDLLEKSADISPAVLGDLKKRYPDIMMARAARLAADEGKEGVMWHAGDVVRAATYGKASGQNAWYGIQGQPGGRLYDAANKLRKRIPGSELRPIEYAASGVVDSETLHTPDHLIQNHLHHLNLGDNVNVDDIGEIWKDLKDVARNLEANTGGRMSIWDELQQFGRASRALDDAYAARGATYELEGDALHEAYRDAEDALRRKLFGDDVVNELGDTLEYNYGVPLLPEVREAALPVASKYDVAHGDALRKSWMLHLPPESREALKKMTFPLLTAGGVMAPTAAYAYHHSES